MRALRFKIIVVISTLLLGRSSYGQFRDINDTTSLLKDTTIIFRNSENNVTDLTTKPALSKYGFLLNDDKKFNPKYRWGGPAAMVTGVDIISWAYNYWQESKHSWTKDSWARISPSTWATNLRSNWWWDADDIETNFIAHPYAGLLSYNVARTHGYNFLQSSVFSAAGSFLWEYFGEDNPPSRNDIIITPVGGMFFGEIIYRITSNILDDRLRGRNRVLRELAAGILNPTRAFSRMAQGKISRVTHGEIYQKAPVNVNLKTGLLYYRPGRYTPDLIFDLQLDYGDAFSRQNKKPFDLFRVRAIKNYSGQVVDNINGYGFLFGKNQKERSLFGWFQNFDYWHTRGIKLSSTGIGPSLISKFPIQKNSILYSSLHLSLIPVAALTSDENDIDTLLQRDYMFGGGLQFKSEQTLHVNKFLTLGFSSNMYWIHDYEGRKQNDMVTIIKPAIGINITKFLGIGFDHEIFYRNNLSTATYKTNAQTHVYLQLFLEDRQRSDRYY